MLAGPEEAEAVTASKQRFPDARITLDPNGAWSLAEAIELADGLQDVLAYAEDPCGAEDGFSGREIMAEFRRATGMPTATNMVATDWRQLSHALAAAQRGHPAGRPALLDDAGFGPGVPDVRRPGADLGLALQQPLRRLPGHVHPRGRRPPPVTYTPLDTHWIWQEGTERLTTEPLQIEGR